MKSRVLLGFVVGAAATAMLAFAAASPADPPSTLISPPNHRHFIQTPSGPVPVGPSICGGATQQAFNAFHYNVHHSVVPGIGDIPTLGPQGGAPGLNNDQGAEIFGVPGCG